MFYKNRIIFIISFFIITMARSQAAYREKFFIGKIYSWDKDSVVLLVNQKKIKTSKHFFKDIVLEEGKSVKLITEGSDFATVKKLLPLSAPLGILSSK